ncbi:hypothetical protein L211DRAFT_850522 [Terfezia boudieri ATCC MYA-4762]|uniref:Uncharacterized protein n=1 Tax=Terfezia boudieri ATCC MYA-4762 TaxID=1051890 RepID=A0A3N4LIB1_9PEZI|nr:hypothetical protein L211DRAFT_850522 [Terfezia boudieri ATCC MYA-4762]
MYHLPGGQVSTQEHGHVPVPTTLDSPRTTIKRESGVTATSFIPQPASQKPQTIPVTVHTSTEQQIAIMPIQLPPSLPGDVDGTAQFWNFWSGGELTGDVLDACLNWTMGPPITIEARMKLAPGYALCSASQIGGYITPGFSPASTIGSSTPGPKVPQPIGRIVHPLAVGHISEPVIASQRKRRVFRALSRNINSIKTAPLLWEFAASQPSRPSPIDPSCMDIHRGRSIKTAYPRFCNIYTTNI